jgi:hypothetical protein
LKPTVIGFVLAAMLTFYGFLRLLTLEMGIIAVPSSSIIGDSRSPHLVVVPRGPLAHHDISRLGQRGRPAVKEERF